eukprot:SAG31_NODE_2061_length_6536_cov_20.366941_2_plen_192_part_00
MPRRVQPCRSLQQHIAHHHYTETRSTAAGGGVTTGCPTELGRLNCSLIASHLGLSAQKFQQLLSRKPAENSGLAACSPATKATAAATVATPRIEIADASSQGRIQSVTCKPRENPSVTFNTGEPVSHVHPRANTLVTFIHVQSVSHVHPRAGPSVTFIHVQYVSHAHPRANTSVTFIHVQSVSHAHPRAGP